MKKGVEINDIDKHSDQEKTFTEPQSWGAIHYIARYGSNPEFLEYIFANYDNINLYTKQNISILHLATLNENIDMLKYILRENLFTSIDEVDNNGSTVFNYALRYSISSEVLDLLELYNCDKYIRDNDGNFGLFYVVQNENIEILKYVIDKKWYKDLLYVNNEGLNCFFYALKYCSNITILKYLEKQTNQFITDKNMTLALVCASINDNSDVLEYFLNNYHVSDINKLVHYKNLFVSALHVAAFLAPKSKTLDILLKYGADINKKTGDGSSFFDLGMCNPSIEINEYILSKIDKLNYPINERLWSFVHFAYCNNPNIEIIKKIRNNYFVEKTIEGFTLLHLAVQNENIDILEYVLFHHIYEDINQVDDKGYTALHTAAIYGKDIKVLNMLLKAGSDPFRKTKEGDTLLGIAVRAENFLITEYLLKKKLFTSIDEVDDLGWSPLHIAAYYNSNKDIISLLYENGSDFKLQTNEKYTLLHCAACNNNYELIEYLLRNKMYIDINQIDSLGRTPLHIALNFSSNLNVIKLLLESGADYKKKTKEIQITCLMCAASNENLDVLKYVIKNKIYEDINEVDYSKLNVLHYAAKYNKNVEAFNLLINEGCKLTSENSISIINFAIYNHNLELLKFILSKNKNININEYDKIGFTPLLIAIRDKGNIEIIDFLIKRGSDISLKTRDGNQDSILHLAIKSNSLEYVDYLINEKIVKDLNEINFDGDTPLHTAVIYNDNTDIMNTLIKHGANFLQTSHDHKSVFQCAAAKSKKCLKYILENKIYHDLEEKDDEGQTAIQISARYGHYPENLIILVEEGANLYVKDKKDATILHCAAKNNDIGIIKTIVEKLKFEDINAVDEDGKTALHYAAEADLFENFKYLFQLGLDPYQECYFGYTPIKLVPSESVKKYNELISLLC